MGQPCDLRDLKRAFPVVAHNLQQLLEFDGDVESTFGLCMQVSCACACMWALHAGELRMRMHVSSACR